MSQTEQDDVPLEENPLITELRSRLLDETEINIDRYSAQMWLITVIGAAQIVKCDDPELLSGELIHYLTDCALLGGLPMFRAQIEDEYQNVIRHMRPVLIPITFRRLVHVSYNWTTRERPT